MAAQNSFAVLRPSKVSCHRGLLNIIWLMEPGASPRSFSYVRKGDNGFGDEMTLPKSKMMAFIMIAQF
jgi:hypothetical protein